MVCVFVFTHNWSVAEEKHQLSASAHSVSSLSGTPVICVCVGGWGRQRERESIALGHRLQTMVTADNVAEARQPRRL